LIPAGGPSIAIAGRDGRGPATLGTQRPEQRHAALEHLDALAPHHLGEDLLAVAETTDRERTRRIMRIAPGQIDAARLEQRAQAVVTRPAVDIVHVVLGQAAGPEGRAARARRQKGAEQEPSSSCFQARACTTALRVSASSRSNRKAAMPAASRSGSGRPAPPSVLQHVTALVAAQARRLRRRAPACVAWSAAAMPAG
jgi:flagellar motor protein MotB